MASSQGRKLSRKGPAKKKQPPRKAVRLASPSQGSKRRSRAVPPAPPTAAREPDVATRTGKPTASAASPSPPSSEQTPTEGVQGYSEFRLLLERGRGRSYLTFDEI